MYRSEAMADKLLHLDRLKEGLCPQHATPLERRDDNGWCDECGTGWSLRVDEVRVHFDFRVAEAR